MGSTQTLHERIHVSSERRSRSGLDLALYGVDQSRRQTATRQIQRLRDTFATLGLHPELGQARNDLAEGIRAFVCRPYVVLYRIEVQGPCILQIVHGFRELRDLFRD